MTERTAWHSLPTYKSLRLVRFINVLLAMLVMKLLNKYLRM